MCRRSIGIREGESTGDGVDVDELESRVDEAANLARVADIAFRGEFALRIGSALALLRAHARSSTPRGIPPVGELLSLRSAALLVALAVLVAACSLLVHDDLGQVRCRGGRPDRAAGLPGRERVRFWPLS